MAELILKQLQGQLFTVISFLLCDRLSNKYHNVHVTNFFFTFSSSLQGDITPPPQTHTHTHTHVAVLVGVLL